MEQRSVGFPPRGAGFGEDGCMLGWLPGGYILQVGAQIFELFGKMFTL